jgi:hypothetical protein
VSATALFASTSRIAHTASPRWALTACLLDVLSTVLLLRAIHRVGRWSATSDGLAIARGIRLATMRGPLVTTVRIELGAARLREPERLLLATIAIAGASTLSMFSGPIGRPDHWIVGLAVIAAAASGSTLFALPVITLLVDVELRRVESSLGAFTLERGASLRVVEAAGGSAAHALVVDGLDAPPLLAASHVGPEQLGHVARTLAALLGDLEVGSSLALETARP